MSHWQSRSAFCAIFLFLTVWVSLYAGPRSALLLLLGLGLGASLEYFGFGFAGPWRRMIRERDASGVIAQLLSIGLLAILCFPLISQFEGLLTPARAPIGFAMIGGAFIFGIAVQLLIGCGSGTLVNAGSGNLMALIALPFFAIGSFAGSFHLIWWTELGRLPIIALEGWSGLALSLLGLSLIACGFFALSDRRKPFLTKRLILIASLLAILAAIHFVTAGRPWGVVYGLGLWVAKFADLALPLDEISAYWAAPSNQARLSESLFLDVTSLTNIGLLSGAAMITIWRNQTDTKASISGRQALVAIGAGFMLGYSARLAFGCNIGAFYSGISTGSLHGWVWFLAAFPGAWVGVQLREYIGLERAK